MPDEKTFKLRYLGDRFAGARLPVNVLADLPAFRDLLVSFAKDEWKKLHPDRKRVPKGFDESLSFDLTMIEPGSAVPNIVWNRQVAQATLPGFEDELEIVVDASYNDILELFDGAGNNGQLKDLSSDKIRALDKFGATLLDGEKIELGTDPIGNVVYLDSVRRKNLITSFRETYNIRLAGVGKLASNSVYGHIIVTTENGKDISIPMEPELIISDFDGSLDQDVQYDILVELDRNDAVRKVIEVYDLTVVDSIESGMLKCRSRLEDLRSLVAGWRDGAGLAVDPIALNTAEKFILMKSSLSTIMRIYPNGVAGVLIELTKGGWDISVEFLPDGSVEMYGIELDGDGEFEPIVFADVGDEFLAAFDNRTAL